MNKVTLISFYPGFFGLNLRQIGACLRESGFDVHYLHLGYGNYSRGTRAPSLKNFFPSPQFMGQIVEEISGSLYVGISLAASEFIAVRDFTTELKKVSAIPVIWGGPQPTASIAESVRYADAVCVGEGEKTAVALARILSGHGDIDEIANLAYLREGVLRQNPPHPLVEDLNSLPIMDTDIYRHKVYFENALRLLTPELLEELDQMYIRPVPGKIVYITTISRGCPNNCSYCNNSYLKKTYEGQKYFRYRSLDHVIREVREALENIKIVGAVFFADDNLTALPTPVLREFSRRWKSEVGIPFGTSGSPKTITDEKLRILAEAGLLYKFGIGVESASPRILSLYERRETPEAAAKAIAIVEKYRPLFYHKSAPPVINYQFIFDNPYETSDDVIATLQFICRLPVRKSITCFHLVMYPGSKIYHEAIRDGKIAKDEAIYMEEFADLRTSWAKVWLYLYRAGVPLFMLRITLLKPLFRALDSRWMRTFYERFLFRRRTSR